MKTTLCSIAFTVLFIVNAVSQTTPDLQILNVQVASLNEDNSYNFISLLNQEYDKMDAGSAFIDPSSIETTVSDAVGSVRFELTGPIERSTIESFAPYALFGDDFENLNLREFPLGEYQLTVTPFEEKRGNGISGTPMIINFSISDNREFEFTGFTVINADTDEEIPLQTISGRNIINADDFKNTKLSLRTDFIGNNKDIVVEFRNSFDEVAQIERKAPYASFGNRGNDYNGEIFPESSISRFFFRAIAYRNYNTTRDIVNFIDIQFNFSSFEKLVKLRDPKIGEVGSRLFDFASGEYRIGGRIGSGDVFVSVFDRLSLDAARLINSVEFTLEGPISYSMIENEKVDLQFSLFGFTDEEYNSRQLIPGTYTFRAIPYTEKDGNGYQGETLEINFSIVENAGQNKIIFTPNPANENTTLRAPKIITSAKLYNMQGLKVREFNNFKDGSSTVNTSDLPVGYYYFKSINNKGVVETEKLLIQH